MIFKVRELCLHQALDQAATDWGDRTGWVFEDTRISFLEMRDRSEAVARSLLALGIGPGDVVATLMPSRVEFALLEFACAMTGAIITGINTRSKSFELEHTLRHSGARLLVSVSSFLKQDYLETLASIDVRPAAPDGHVAAPAFPRLERVVCPSAGSEAGAMPWVDFLRLGEQVDDAQLQAVKAARNWRDPVVLQYTSGTTAFPKGALCDHRYVLNCGVETFLLMGVKPGEPVFSTQPFYHIGGSCSTVPLPLSLGGAMVIPEVYDAERVLQLIARERCVARTGFGTMYVMEMNLPNFSSYDIGPLRAGWCIATPALMEQIRDRFGMPDLIPLYAATEVGGTVCSKDEPWEDRSTSCGRPLTGAEMRIADESDQPLPAGQHGEIQMRSWWQMIGYLDQPDATAKAVSADGWIKTGDLGWIDERGCLHFAGRIKEMMKIGGENVSAEEVENILMQLPAVKQVAAFGVPDDRLVEVVAVAIELREGHCASAEQIIEHCKSRTANFRVPRHVRFVTEWPMTGSGKIQKRLLKEAFNPSNPDLNNQ